MRIGVTLAALLALVVGCSSTVEEEHVEVTSDDRPTREITLSTGDRISVAVDVEGHGRVKVVIAPGKPNTGTYTSTADALIEPARTAKNSLNNPGATVSIRVNDDNEIVSLAHSQKG